MRLANVLTKYYGVGVKSQWDRTASTSHISFCTFCSSFLVGTPSAYPCRQAGKVADLNRRFPLLFGISAPFLALRHFKRVS